MKTGGFRGRVTATAPIFVLALMTGCKSWHPVMETPATWIARENPPEVRLTAATGVQVTIASPIVVNDSIVSATTAVVAGPFAPPRPGVLVSDVAVVERSRFSAMKTAALGAGILAMSITWARTVGERGRGGEIPEPPVEKLAPGLRLMWRVFP